MLHLYKCSQDLKEIVLKVLNGFLSAASPQDSKELKLWTLLDVVFEPTTRSFIEIPYAILSKPEVLEEHSGAVMYLEKQSLY